MAIALVMAISTCSRNAERYETALAAIDITENQFRAFKTKSGLNAAKADAQIGTLQQVIDAMEGKMGKLQKELELKPKSIEKVVTIYVEGQDSVVMVRDTMVKYVYSGREISPYIYRDAWNSFEAYMGDDGQIGLKYSVMDSIYLVQHVEKGGVFKRKKSSVSALSMNPAVSIKGLSSLEVAKEKRKRVSVGPFVGLGTDGKATAGVGVQYGLIQF